MPRHLPHRTSRSAEIARKDQARLWLGLDTGYLELSDFQAKTASATAYTMLLDLVIDLGVSVLLSRQVVDVGGAGVG